MILLKFIPLVSILILILVAYYYIYYYLLKQKQDANSELNEGDKNV